MTSLASLIGKMLGATKSAPKLVGYQHGDTGGDNDVLVINKPSGVQAGDLMVAIMGMGSNNTTWSGDTGWTEVIDQNARPANIRVAWKIATGSEASSYTFTQATARASSGIILHFRNATFDQISASVTIGSPCVITSITPTKRGILIAAYLDDNSGVTFGDVSGMTEVAAFSTETASYRVFKQEVAAGATGTRSSQGSTGACGGVLFNVI